MKKIPNIRFRKGCIHALNDWRGVSWTMLNLVVLRSWSWPCSRVLLIDDGLLWRLLGAVQNCNGWQPLASVHPHGQENTRLYHRRSKRAPIPNRIEFRARSTKIFFVLSLTFSLSHSLAAKFFVPLLHLEMKKGRFHSNFDVGLSKLFLLSLLPSCGKIK